MDGFIGATLFYAAKLIVIAGFIVAGWCVGSNLRKRKDAKASGNGNQED